MKILYAFLFPFLIAVTGYSQDMIILKTGEEIKSNVLEISPDLVKYKNWNNQSGPIYSIKKSEVFMIKYKNGSKEVFYKPASISTSSNQNSNNPSIMINIPVSNAQIELTKNDELLNQIRNYLKKIDSLLQAKQKNIADSLAHPK